MKVSYFKVTIIEIQSFKVFTYWQESLVEDISKSTIIVESTKSDTVSLTRTNTGNMSVVF